jgi:hypothetical protein
MNFLPTACLAAASGLGLLALACGSSSPSTGGDAGRPDGGTDASPQDGPVTDASSEGGPPTGPLCTVASKGTSGVVLSGRLLLPGGASDGELFINAGGTIACAAPSCSTTSGYSSATRIACPKGVISPSLINPHDHTEFATRAPEAHGMIRYEHRNDWRRGADGATPLPNVESSDDVATNAAQELRFVLGGATSVVGTGGAPGLLRNLAAYSDLSWLEGLTGKTVFFDTFPLGDSDGQVITSGCGYPDIISSGEAFEDGIFAPHLAEGINLAAENELTCASGATHGLVTSKTSVIHGVGVDAKDVAVIANAGARLIWSPRSNVSLYGDTAPLTEYRTAGVTIALGTDWLPSGSMNMLRELACADTFNQKYWNAAFSDQDLWEMATLNAASAAGFDSEIGSLAVGKVADVAVFDGRANADYRAVIAAGVEDVHLVLRGGKALYGDRLIVSALATGCDALPVCGEDRALCFDVTGVTLPDVQAAAASIYPLFFCKGTEPTAEPTCVPYRDTYPLGLSATDRDGDGVPDKSDDCPDIFNPPRPLDDNKQADVDGDGFGDACDTKPLDAATH